LDGVDLDPHAETVPRRPSPIVRDIKIQRAIAVHIGQRHGEAGGARSQSGGSGDLLKMALAVIKKSAHTLAHGTNQQIQVTIAVQVGQNGAGGILPWASHAGGFCYILELPPTAVSKEFVWTIQPAEVEITPAVPIDISRRHA
jgi:hypothetical protein